ncbi:sulfite exporter TauE/SafE family protein [Paracoccaceae bacterium GXU_MW_L88]
MDFLLLTLFLAAIGAFAGVIAGLLGVGGGIVLVPAFYYAFQILGYESAQLMQICVATSLATIVVTSLRSLGAHNKKGAVEWPILKLWAPFIAVGALVGVVVASGLKSRELMIIFGVIGFAVGVWMAIGKRPAAASDDMPTGGKRAVIGTGIGFFSTLMGIGGGSFGVPLMVLYGRPIHRAVATAAGFGALIAVPSVAGFLLAGQGITGKPPYTIGYVNLPAFAIVVCMTMLTAPYGAALAHRLDPVRLKRVFAYFVMLMALNMLRKALF